MRQLLTLIADLFRTFLPTVTDHGHRGGWRFSKESLGSLVIALLGIGTALGFFTPEAIDSAPEITAGIWDAASQLTGLIVMVFGLVSNAKRHREANGG